MNWRGRPLERTVPLGAGRPTGCVRLRVGLIIAALALARRRWPLAVVLASSATLQVYYLSDYTSTYAAVPLGMGGLLGGADR
jgi:hypothetical protein